MVPRDPRSVRPEEGAPFDRRALAVVGVGLLAMSIAVVTVVAVVLIPSTTCGCDPLPRFTFAENGSGDARTVTITVASGRGSYDRYDLAVAVGDNLTNWTALPGGTTNGSTHLSPGESVTLNDLSRGDEVEIRWRPESGDGSHVVANYTVAGEGSGGSGDGSRNASSADSRRRPAPPRR